jgi:GTP-binding protein
MLIKSVEFAGAIGQVGQASPASVVGLPQVVFSGRSNVGKSSLINRLLGRTRTPIARVSSTPGKTQEINFFRVRTDLGEFTLVDLPGYGYARAPGALRDKWRHLIGEFLASSSELRGVVQLVDIRHGATEDDYRAIKQIADLSLPVLFVLTKADKLRPQRRKVAVSNITDQLEVDPGQVIPFSVLSGEGVDDLREAVGGLVGSAEEGGDAEAGGGDEMDEPG